MKKNNKKIWFFFLFNFNKYIYLIIKNIYLTIKIKNYYLLIFVCIFYLDNVFGITFLYQDNFEHHGNEILQHFTIYYIG